MATDDGSSPLHSTDTLASPSSLRSPISETFEYEKNATEQLPLQNEFGSVRLISNYGELNQGKGFIEFIPDLHTSFISKIVFYLEL